MTTCLYILLFSAKPTLFEQYLNTLKSIPFPIQDFFRKKTLKPKSQAIRLLFMCVDKKFKKTFYSLYEPQT